MKSETLTIVDEEQASSFGSAVIGDYFVKMISVLFEEQGVMCSYEIFRASSRTQNVTNLNSRYQSKIDIFLRGKLTEHIRNFFGEFGEEELAKAVKFPSRSSAPGLISVEFTHSWLWRGLELKQMN